MRKFYVSSDAISTTDALNLKKWGGGGNFREIVMPETPVGELLGGRFDFISIDTEGTSVDILKSIDLLVHKPVLVCVEHDGRIAESEKFLSSKKYEIIFKNGTNFIAKRGS
jgi:hypothetical protein